MVTIATGVSSALALNPVEVGWKPGLGNATILSLWERAGIVLV